MLTNLGEGLPVLKLWREQSFWVQPWFLAIAIVAGQAYGGWWLSLAVPEPAYVPSSLVIASAQDAFDMTITAPDLPHEGLRSAAF